MFATFWEPTKQKARVMHLPDNVRAYPTCPVSNVTVVHPDISIWLAVLAVKNVIVIKKVPWKDLAIR